MKYTNNLPALLTLCFQLISVLPSSAQWTEIPVPYGFYIYNDLAVHHDKVYMSTYSQNQIICASTADKLHWSLEANLQVDISNGLSNIVSDGERLYLFAWNQATPQAACLFSEDDAQTWTPVPLPENVPIKLFVPLGDMLLCASGSVIYRSQDSGISWDTVLQTVGTINSIKRLHDQVLLVTTTEQLYRSENGGALWSGLPTPYDATGNDYPRLNIYPTHLGTFIEYRTDSLSTFYRSFDDGDSWLALPMPTRYPEYSQVWDLEAIGDQLFGIFNSGIAVSEDNGLSWEFRLSPPGTLRLASKGDSLFAGGSSGFFKSYDLAATWFTGNLGWEQIGLSYSPFYSPQLITFHKDKLFLSTSDGLFSTENEGLEWQLHFNDNGLFSQMFTTGDTILFTGHGGLRSFDDGLSWEYLIPDSFSTNPLAGSRIFAQAGNYLFATSWFDQYLFRSPNWGETWQPLSTSFFFIDYIAATGNKLFLGTYDGVWQTTNYGNTFSQTNTGLGNNPYIDGLWSTGNDLFTESNDQLYRLSGTQWKPASSGLYDEFGNLPYILNIIGSGNLKVLTGFSSSSTAPYIFISQNNGQSWEGNLAETLPASYELLTTLKNNSIYATGVEKSSSDLYIWKRELTVHTGMPNLQKPAFKLTPNPTRGDSWLHLEHLPESRTCQVALYDALGRLQWESGTFSGTQLQLPVSGFTPGVYTVVLKTAQGIVGQKRLVVQE
ncbi:MAG: T9SS type A sorting domain-containing protein [Lewinellaceae bacterium]|nr:T9SS type A sorting domain-containing protein [Lewinellaceae bacterium]